MNIVLYQIDFNKDSKRMMFRDYEAAMKAGGVDPNIYEKVYEGELPCDTLEGAFTFLNVGAKPDGYSGRSMSVSDVLCVVSSDSVAPGYYFCDSIGFKEITFPRNQKCRFRENGKCAFGDGAAECAKEKGD